MSEDNVIPFTPPAVPDTTPTAMATAQAAPQCEQQPQVATATAPDAPDAPPPLPPGLHAFIPDTEYHRRPEISKHGLDQLDVCPAEYIYGRTNERPATPALRFGKLLHLAVFQPGVFASQTAVLPDGIDRRTKDGKARWAAFEAENLGREIVNADEHAKLITMQAAVRAHPAASALLGDVLTSTEQSPRAELTAVWQDEETGAMCRSRYDYLHPQHIIVDLKKCASVSPDDFARAAFNFRYDVQAAFYLDGYAALNRIGKISAPPRGFVWVCVQDEPPYHVAVYAATPAWLELGRNGSASLARRGYRQNLQRYVECLREDRWPGFSDEIVSLDMPGFVGRALEAAGR